MGKLESYFKRLYDLSIEQNRVLLEENVDEFQRMGEERESIIAQMKAQNLEKEVLEEEERNLLIRLNAQDKQNEKLLEKQMEQVKLQIRNLSEYSRRDKKYIDNYPDLAAGRYFDK